MPAWSRLLLPMVTMTVGVCLWMGSPSSVRAQPAAACEHHLSQRQAFFGDLHVHTALSLDAATQGTRTRPADAYAFARGAPLELQPFDAQGRGLRHLQLSRPLDFAAVTDHAELMGEVAVCSDPLHDPFSRLGCAVYRSMPRMAFFWMNAQASYANPLRLCGDGRQDCIAARTAPWKEVQQAAETFNEDTGACRFTTFSAYEWTGAKDGGNIHRNIIFANDQVPDQPIDFYAAPSAELLHDTLRATCGPDSDSPRCRFISIPHNGNLAKGNMFAEAREDGSPMFPDAESAMQRAIAEPLVEIMQHKGQSECWPGSADEQCGFEALPYHSFPDKFLPGGGPPDAMAGWARQTVARGIAIEAETGANPFRLGFIGSTDTHLGAPGAAAESDFLGHGGAGQPAEEGAAGLPDDPEFNPGGLVGVWAEENTRAALFSAFERREVFATSGPRIQVRTFAALPGELPEEICQSDDPVGENNLNGRATPMGGQLTLKSAGPTIFVDAHADPEGAGLQRIQLVRLRWTDGALDAEVVDIAGDAGLGVDAKPQDCAMPSIGARRLCAVWTDPEPATAAAYYARVLEVPTCRWSQRLCVAAGVDCSGKVDRAWAPCCEANHQPLVQERAWSSPTWTRPEP